MIPEEGRDDMASSTSAAPPPALSPNSATPISSAAQREREPLRAELFGIEHLEAHAQALAAMRVAPPSTPGIDLLGRFRQVVRQLDHAYERISEAARRQEVLGPDAEWLLDNYHIV